MNKEQFDLLLQELRNINESIQDIYALRDEIRDLTNVIDKKEIRK